MNIPICVSIGDEVVFRQFTDANVLLPMNNAERAIVAETLREILLMVQGEVTLPSFSMADDASCSPRTLPDPDDRKCGVVDRLAALLDNQKTDCSARRVRPHPNDN